MLDSHASHGTIFIVDDDASVRRALARLFASVGLLAETFDGAQDFLARRPPILHGCLILDIKMPGMNGLDLQSWLYEQHIELPIIFVTAHADVPIAVRAMKGGANEVFTKPFDESALLDAVNRALAQDEERIKEQQERLKEQQEVELLRERYNTLTSRERTVMGMVVTGTLNKQIASALGTSLKTIKAHRARVMEKMGADSLATLVRTAVRLGISSE
jgi:FixJ family two-component response regulator